MSEPLTDNELEMLRMEALNEQTHPGKHGQWERLVLRLLATLDAERARQAEPAGLREAAHEPGPLDVEAITGPVLARAWVLSGRPAPLIEPDEWDGFALTVRAIIETDKQPKGRDEVISS
jgi:hypothetical protein